VLCQTEIDWVSSLNDDTIVCSLLKKRSDGWPSCLLKDIIESSTILMGESILNFRDGGYDEISLEFPTSVSGESKRFITDFIKNTEVSPIGVMLTLYRYIVQDLEFPDIVDMELLRGVGRRSSGSLNGLFDTMRNAPGRDLHFMEECLDWPTLNDTRAFLRECNESEATASDQVIAGRSIANAFINNPNKTDLRKIHYPY